MGAVHSAQLAALVAPGNTAGREGSSTDRS